MESVGARIRSRREELGLTQDELAKRLGYKNRASVAKIEANANFMTSTKLMECSKILQCSIDYLLDGKEKTRSLTSNQQELLSIMEGLPDDKQVELLGMGRYLYYQQVVEERKKIIRKEG